MLLCNIEVAIGLVNGTIGTVKEITNDCILIEYLFNNKNYYTKITRTNKNHLILKQCITRKQFPIVLAYWITFHKLQGQTFNNLIIHCSNLKVMVFLFCFILIKIFQKSSYKITWRFQIYN